MRSSNEIPRFLNAESAMLPPGPSSSQKLMSSILSAELRTSMCLRSEPATRRGAGKGLRSVHHPRFHSGLSRHGLPLGIRGAPSTDRDAHRATVPKLQTARKGPLVVSRSWQQVSNLWLPGKRLWKFSDDLDANRSAGRQFREASRPRNPMIQHQEAVGSLVNPGRRHSRRGSAEQSDLSGEPPWVRSLSPRWRNPQLARIDIAKIRHRLSGGKWHGESLVVSITHCSTSANF
jgi:hypothetical protein